MKSLLPVLIAFVSFSAVAQDTQVTSYMSVEVDPAPFLLNGYSVSLKYSPKKMSKTAFMASVFSSEFPNSMMSQANKEEGWTDLKLETSFAIFGEFYINANRRGFYYGPSLFLYNKSVTLEPVNQRTNFSTLYPNVRAGYIWYPFKTIDLYVNPWINAGSEINIDNNNSLNGQDFEPNRFNFILALHIGYSFNEK